MSSSSSLSVLRLFRYSLVNIEFLNGSTFPNLNKAILRKIRKKGNLLEMKKKIGVLSFASALKQQQQTDAWFTLWLRTSQLWRSRDWNHHYYATSTVFTFVFPVAAAKLQHKLVSFYDLVITGPQDNLTTLILGHLMDYCKLSKLRQKNLQCSDQHLWTAGLWFSMIAMVFIVVKNLPNGLILQLSVFSKHCVQQKIPKYT